MSALIYAAFSAMVFLVHGNQPPLGSDHITYFEVADSILSRCPNGNYWRETNSVRFFSVLLAYLHGLTGSHVLSMKLMLAVMSVLFLLASELFFRTFTDRRWQAVLFALLSAFAVSFGIASWGVTDSTAMLPRTLVAPLLMLSAWLWFRFDGRSLKYLAFPLLAAGSFIHLSVFHVMGVLGMVEVLDFAFMRRMRVDWRVPAFIAAVASALGLAFALEIVGLSSKQFGTWLPLMLRAAGIEAPYLESPTLGTCLGKWRPPEPASATSDATANPGPVPPAPPAPAAPSRPTAKQAWDIELSVRPWRNMPLPLVNVANALSSSALILLIALAGVLLARRQGFNRMDQVMALMFVAVPVFSFGPQTALWILRNFTGVYPMTIEEVRAISLVMIPALYFILRLFKHVVDGGDRGAAVRGGAIVAGVVSLPLLMKALPFAAREGIMSALLVLHIVDPANASMVSNAQAALGIRAPAPLYYSTRNVVSWLAANTPPGTGILTDRDDMILLRDRRIIGPRQVVATTFTVSTQEKDLFIEISRAMGAHDLPRLMSLAESQGASFVVVPGVVPHSAYSDGVFSVVRVPGRS